MIEINTYGSPWDILGESPEKIAKKKARSRIMIDINRHIKAMEGTQEEKAKALGLTQPRLNKLLKNRISEFSLDALIAIAYRLGLEVSVGVRTA